MAMRFEMDEVLHILISVITISITFSLFNEQAGFWLILCTLGLGFILHELGHKFVAQSYGAYAIYRAWWIGLLIAIGLAIVTEGKFIFAAPGAVVIYGRHLTQEQNGRISIAGSSVNFVLALVFLSIAYAGNGYEMLGRTGAYINAFLGAFNMIPIYPLDGQKVQMWSESAWLAIVVLCWGLLFLMMFGIV
ncbi:MAG: hypothetical protein ABIG96_06735 [Candidatus Micrarchaeota archaeon]